MGRNTHNPCSWILNAELGNCVVSHLDGYREDQPELDLSESWDRLAWDGCQPGPPAACEWECSVLWESGRVLSPGVLPAL